MKKTIYLFFIIFSIGYTEGFSQNKSTDAKKEILQAMESLIQNPNLPSRYKKKLLEQKKIESPYSNDELWSITDYIMLIYVDQNQFKEAYAIGSKIKKLPATKSAYTISDVYRLNALALGGIGFFEESLNDYRTAIKYAKKIDNNDTRLYMLSLCYENITQYFASKSYFGKNGSFVQEHRDSIQFYLIKSLDAAKGINSKEGAKKYSSIAFTYVRLGIFYMEESYQGEQHKNLDLAEQYLLEALKIYENPDYNLPKQNETMLLNQLSWLYFERKDYEKSIHYANLALDLEKNHNDPYHRVESFEFLAKSFLEINQKDKSKFYMDEYTYLKDSLRISERNSIDTPLNQIITVKEKENKSRIKILFIYGGVLFVVLLIIGSIVWKIFNQKLKNEYEKLIYKLKTESTHKKTEEPEIITTEELVESVNEPEIDSNSKEKSIQITENTVKTILARLERFENSDKYLKKEINLTYLASQVGTNTKYLSEIIKQHKEKSFSSYINGLRINYIATLLYKEPKYREYKISYLADMCGFSSREVFAVVFKKETGISPSYYIENLKDNSGSE